MARKVHKKTLKFKNKEIKAEEQYLNNDPTLPTEESKYEFTEDMIDAMAKASEDIIYFAENFFTIIDATVRKKIPLREYQKRILNTMAKNNRVVLNTSRQIGKCVTKDTKIKIRLKWLPFIKFNIKIGTFFNLCKIAKKLHLIF